MKMKPFQIERFFARYEFKAPYYFQVPVITSGTGISALALAEKTWLNV
jgi:hypothetical protein